MSKIKVKDFIKALKEYDQNSYVMVRDVVLCDPWLSERKIDSQDVENAGDCEGRFGEKVVVITS